MKTESKTKIHKFTPLTQSYFFKLWNFDFMKKMCNSKKYPYPPHRRSMKFRGGGDLKSMGLNWKFQRGGGIQTKKSSVGGVWIFSGTTQCGNKITKNASFGNNLTRRKLINKNNESYYQMFFCDSAILTTNCIFQVLLICKKIEKWIQNYMYTIILLQ